MGRSYVKTLCDSWISNESPRIFPKIADRAATEGPKGCFLMAGVTRLSLIRDNVSLSIGLRSAEWPRSRVAVRFYLARFKQQNGGSYMPDSAVMTFTEPDAFHAAIRTAEVKGVVTVR